MSLSRRATSLAKAAGARRNFSGGVEHHHIHDKNLKDIIQPPGHILRNGECDSQRGGTRVRTNSSAQQIQHIWPRAQEASGFLTLLPPNPDVGHISAPWKAFNGAALVLRFDSAWSGLVQAIQPSVKARALQSHRRNYFQQGSLANCRCAAEFALSKVENALGFVSSALAWASFSCLLRFCSCAAPLFTCSLSSSSISPYALAFFPSPQPPSSLLTATSPCTGSPLKTPQGSGDRSPSPSSGTASGTRWSSGSSTRPR